jgi:hypothetical protein
VDWSRKRLKGEVRDRVLEARLISPLIMKREKRTEGWFGTV